MLSNTIILIVRYLRLCIIVEYRAGLEKKDPDQDEAEKVIMDHYLSN